MRSNTNGTPTDKIIRLRGISEAINNNCEETKVLVRCVVHMPIPEVLKNMSTTC